MRKVIFIFLLTSLETIVFIFCRDYFFPHLFSAPPLELLDLAFRATIALGEFIIFALLLNTFIIAYPDISAIWPIVAVCIFYSIIWVADLLDNRVITLKLLLSAWAGFVSSYLFVQLLRVTTKEFNKNSRTN